MPLTCTTTCTCRPTWQKPEILGKLAGFAFLAFAAFVLSACAHGLSRNQISALMSENFVETDAGWELNLNSRLLFDSESTNLSDREKDNLDQVAKTLLSVGITRIVVEGHTDSTGTADYNKQLSQKRAQIVADYLVGKGMPAAEITVRGLGDSVPVGDNRTAGGRRLNRRTIIIVPVQ
jgi:outer membrane protein OmpA-like peptidoglycan-associated protein